MGGRIVSGAELKLMWGIYSIIESPELQKYPKLQDNTATVRPSEGTAVDQGNIICITEIRTDYRISFLDLFRTTGISWRMEPSGRCKLAQKRSGTQRQTLLTHFTNSHTTNTATIISDFNNCHNYNNFPYTIHVPTILSDIRKVRQSSGKI